MRWCDVLVAGGGPAGCAVAAATARAGLATLLLDQWRQPRRWSGESLPPGMDAPVIAAFGAGILSEEVHVRATGSRSAWGSDDLVETDFLRNPLGDGWLLDRARFDDSARTAAVGAGASVIAIRRLGKVERARAGWRVEVEGDAVAARFLVDATGRAAALLRRLGIRRVAADMQIAHVAVFADDGDGWRGTSVEAAAESWWYSTPLPGGRRVLAWLTDSDLWQKGAGDWSDALGATRHMKRIAGPGARAARPAAFPADMAAAEQIAGDGWLAVGEAAVSFDPLSSQGLASAVLMGTRAGEAIAGPDREAEIAAWIEDYTMLAAEHAGLRAHYARLEHRWPESAFWRRRQSPSSIAWVSEART
ncbi:MAG: FAD-dependent oxidoreductase [Amaricoccus sp.]